MAIPPGPRGASRPSKRSPSGRRPARPAMAPGQRSRAHPFAAALKRAPALAANPREPAGQRPRDRREALASEPRAAELPAARERAHDRRREPFEPEVAPLEAFRAMPILMPTVESSAAAPGSGLERAQAAAMAERLLHSVRVGKVAGGHEVRMTLAGARVEVRLRQQGESLVPELHLADDATGADRDEAERLAARLDTELRDAGLDFEEIAIVR